MEIDRIKRVQEELKDYEVEEVVARRISHLPSEVGQHVLTVDVDREFLPCRRVALERFSVISGSPAAASSVGRRSWCETIPLSTAPAGIWLGQRTKHGTRQPPSQLVFFPSGTA